MKIKVDKQNKAVIAEGHLHGKYIHAVSVCAKNDTFDENFGKTLVNKKYQLKETLAKIKEHQTIISDLRSRVAGALAIIEDEQRIINALDNKQQVQEEDIQSLIKSKYSI